jgi:predicted GNAT family acetyltransferase
MEEAGRRPGGVNGAVRWSDPFTAAWARRGAQPAVRRELRAFELTRVVHPAPPPGGFREAGADDLPQVAAWVQAMGDDIDEPVDEAEAERVARRVIGGGDLCLWERDGRPVSMAGITRRTPWSSCVALVYTPPEHRRHGYASAVVAALSQRELDAGYAWCSLFTDLANPTSNHIYAELGYQPRCDFRHHELTWFV